MVVAKFVVPTGIFLYGKRAYKAALGPETCGGQISPAPFRGTWPTCRRRGRWWGGGQVALDPGRVPRWGGGGGGGEVKAREDGEPTAPCSVVDGEGPVRGARSPYGDRPRQLEPVGKGDQLADTNERTDTERSILFTDPNSTQWSDRLPPAL